MNRREEFGQRLKDLRILRGLTVADVAAGTGLRENTIRNLESGKFSADFDIIDKIAEFYEMDITLN